MKNECDEFVESWPAYEDGELPPAERRRVEAHLSQCRACAAEAASFQKSWAAFSGAYAAVARVSAPPRAAPAAVLSSGWLLPLALSAGAAAAALLLVRRPAPRDVPSEAMAIMMETDDRRNMELSLTQGGPEPLAQAWAREIGGVPYE